MAGAAATMKRVQPTASDLCELLDRIARSPDTVFALDGGWSLYGAVQDAGFVPAGQADTVAWLVGELVTDGRLAFRSRLGAGQPTPPPGVSWVSHDLQNHVGYRLTSDGRRDAETTRKLRREREVGEALAGTLPREELRALGSAGAAAVAQHATELEVALLDGRWAAAVGASKDLVESTAHAVLAARGEPMPPATKVTSLIRAALDADDERAPGWTLARGIANVTQGLSELRNEEGSGHGRAVTSDVGAIEAEFAATTAAALAHLLVRRHAGLRVAR